MEGDVVRKHKLSLDKKIALKVSLIYAVIAACWILFSDQFLLWLVRDPHKLTLLQSVKGWFFVVFTAVLLFLLFKKEIHKQILVENKLRRNRARLNETQKIARLGSWKLNVSNNELWWSEETYRIFGFEEDEEITWGKFINSIHPDDKQQVTCLIDEAIKHGTPLKLDYRIVMPDGDIRYLHEESQAIYDESYSEVVKRVGSVQVVTEQKQMEKERENLINKLEKSLEEIKTLRGILPICSYCKKVRDSNGNWEQIDVYIHKNSDADISHSICPTCMKKHYPEMMSEAVDDNLK